MPGGQTTEIRRGDISCIFESVSLNSRLVSPPKTKPNAMQNITNGAPPVSGPGVRSPHGASWQADWTLRTGIHISRPRWELCSSCSHQFISQTAASHTLSLSINMHSCFTGRTHAIKGRLITTAGLSFYRTCRLRIFRDAVALRSLHPPQECFCIIWSN